VQRSDLTLIGEVLLSYGLQAAVCLVVAWILFDFARRQTKRHLRWWAFSWIACFLYLVSAAAALYTVGFLGMGAKHWLRLGISSISMAAGLLQPTLMALGTYEGLRGRDVSTNRQRTLLLLVGLTGLAVGISSAWLPSDSRLTFRLGVRAILGGGAFLTAAVMLLRVEARRRTVGIRLLGITAVVYGLEQFNQLGWSIANSLGNLSTFPYYLGYFDTLLQFFMALGMLLWHLESERMRSERALTALEQSRDGLRQAQKMEVVGRLAGGVAHDFNNLMTVMFGATESLALAHPPGSHGRNHVRLLEDSLQRARSLTSQLLVFSRRQIQRDSRVSVASFIIENKQMLQRFVGSDIEVKATFASRSPEVFADPGQLSQVLMNLAANAKDAMPAGGVLRLHVSTITKDSDREDATIPELLKPGIYTRIDVCDSGKGMNAEVRNKAFEPFFTTKPAGQGTGLGLPTVYGIVEAAGGAVTIDSAPGRGTAVSVFWPEVHATNAAAGPAPTESVDPNHKPTPPPVTPQPEARLRVLVVDDEEPIRMLLTGLLNKRGYDVRVAKDGAEALMMLTSEGPFDALVTDVIMPGMGGGELIHAARQKMPDLVMLAVSGYAGDLVERAIPEDIAWLQKPFTSAQLFETIDRLLANRKPTDKAAQD
jgi:signal transduction histidine kinase/CheY-like chemotaxis protein